MGRVGGVVGRSRKRKGRERRERGTGKESLVQFNITCTPALKAPLALASKAHIVHIAIFTKWPQETSSTSTGSCMWYLCTRVCMNVLHPPVQ